jgi:hypothetical protein
MQVRFFNIQWDTESNGKTYSPRALGLPVEVVREVDPDDMDGMTFDEYMNQEGADLLSDQFGWCVYGYDYEVVTEKKE